MGEIMYCKYCGEKVNDNAYVCLKCGSRVGKLENKSKNQGIVLGIIAASLEGVQLMFMGLGVLADSIFVAVIALILIYIPISIAVLILSIFGTTFGFSNKNKVGSILNLITLIVCILSFIAFIIYLSANRTIYYY